MILQNGKQKMSYRRIRRLKIITNIINNFYKNDESE